MVVLQEIDYALLLAEFVILGSQTVVVSANHFSKLFRLLVDL